MKANAFEQWFQGVFLVQATGSRISVLILKITLMPQDIPARTNPNVSWWQLQLNGERNKNTKTCAISSVADGAII